MTTTDLTTSCPFLRRVVMAYCDACPMKKMVAVDQLVSEGPCLAASPEDCALYREAVARSSASGFLPELSTETASSEREVSP